MKPRWLFLKMHTDAGIVGLGEPITEGRALTCEQAVKEIEPYLVGKDPRAVVHHWQAIHRHAFYRGGPILTSALERHRPGAVGHQGQGARRARLRAARRADARPRASLRPCRHAEAVKNEWREGFTAFKTGLASAANIAPIRGDAGDVRYGCE